MSDETAAPNLPLAEVGRYALLSQARERGLVVSAMELPHWIVREGPVFVLRVEERSRDVVARELERFEAERRELAAQPRLEPPVEKIETSSLYVAGWLMSGCWLAQNLVDEKWIDRGEAMSRRIVEHGEWWRALTALTLHGDFAHFAANLVTGLIFAAFAIPHLGAGLAWLAIVLSGLLGNLLNAWFYSAQSHTSIGASTAVFGALGLVVGGEFVTRFSSPHTRSRWQLVLPLGAGLALLAWLGVGDEQKRTDYMAHFWGFIAGIALGAASVALRLKKRAPRPVQRVCAVLGPALLGFAWWVATR